MPGIQRLGLHEQLAEHHGRASADTLWSALCSVLLIVVPLALAIAADTAFLFASIGPIIYELVERPVAPASSPRNVIVGNVLALLVGYSALAIFGLRAQPSSIVEGVTVARAVAVVYAIGVLGALLALLDMMHPPAGATALLVALGILREPAALLVMFAAVVVTTVLGFVLNRAAGIAVPRWAPLATSHAVVQPRVPDTPCG